MRLELTLQEAESLRRHLVETLALQVGLDDEQVMGALLNKVVEAQEMAVRETVCPVCQQPFTQERVGRTGCYCSAACKQKAYRRRRDEWAKQFGPRVSR